MNEKQKLSVYLTDETKQKLNELFVVHFLKNEKQMYSDIVSEAIGTLHTTREK